MSPLFSRGPSIKVLNKERLKIVLRMGLDVPEKECAELMGQILEYIVRCDSSYNWVKIKEIEQETLKKEDRVMETYMDKVRKKATQQGMQKGIQQGMQQGRQEVIFNMLKKQLDIELISEVTGLPTKEIKKLKNGSN